MPAHSSRHLTAPLGAEARPNTARLATDGEAAVTAEIVRLLRTFYQAGRVPCADPTPLHIAFEADTDQVRLWSETSSAQNVLFPEEKFVEMVCRSGMPPTATLIRVWLATVYFDWHVYKWARTE
jgi:hypothetical protein